MVDPVEPDSNDVDAGWDLDDGDEGETAGGDETVAFNPSALLKEAGFDTSKLDESKKTKSHPLLDEPGAEEPVGRRKTNQNQRAATARRMPRPSVMRQAAAKTTPPKGVPATSESGPSTARTGPASNDLRRTKEEDPKPPAKKAVPPPPRAKKASKPPGNRLPPRIRPPRPDEPMRRESRRMTPFVAKAEELAKELDQRATMPPPVPEAEYVSKMMEEEEQPLPRERLDTITEDDPLQYDLGDETPMLGVPIPREARRIEAQTPVAMRRPAERKAAAARDETPQIETKEEYVDLPDELLRDTPVPPASELDELAVDSVLESAALSNRPPQLDDLEHGALAERESHPSTISDIPMPPSSDRASEPVAAAPIDDDDPILRDIAERFDVGDYSTALVLAEGAAEEHPDHEGVRRYVESCQDMLRQMYLGRLGGGECVPKVTMSPDQLGRLALDHRVGFLLACIDGMCSIDELLDVSSMPHLEAVRTLYELVQEGVIEIEPPGR